MFPILEAALAFIGVMLAASLMVTAIVRMIHAAAKTRKRGVPDMLMRLHHGFRYHRKDNAINGDAYERQFVVDVLSNPILHTTSAYERLKPYIQLLRLENSFVDPRDKKLQRYKVEQLAYEEAYFQLSRSIEFLSHDDLKTIVKELSVERDGLHVIPGSWRARIADKDALTEDFLRYIDDWFPTVEGTISQEFGERARRLALIVSCTVVVLLNLDSIRLAQNLYNDPALSENLVSKLSDLQESAERLDEGGGLDGFDNLDRDDDLADLKLEVQNAAAFMTDDRLSIGWHGSYISKEWCSYREACQGGEETNLRSFLHSVALWLVGLLFSCLLVSQGAPFWVNRLRELLRLKHAVQANKEKST